MSRTVLHILSQRPQQTGSGVTLDALVACAAEKGWRQHAVVGVPSSEPTVAIADLGPDQMHPLFFGTETLPFAVPGMSDVMPYESTRFSSMSEAEIDAYQRAWQRHLKRVIEKTRPDIIHSHHIWIVSALIKAVAPAIPVVTQCHATGLRQAVLCPHLADDVWEGCRRNDAFLALHAGHADQLGTTLGVPKDRISVIGAGYNEALFHPRGRIEPQVPTLVYVGKLSPAKGLPQLLLAVHQLLEKGHPIEMHVAGAGSGQEAESIREQIKGMYPAVRYCGQLSQPALADLLRRCTLCVLPSFYEGMPLVLVEAFACGCRLISTPLPGVVDALMRLIPNAIDTVPMPPLIGIDTPDPSHLPRFTLDLERTIARAIKHPPLDTEDIAFKNTLASFTWEAVFDRVESTWASLIKS
ncbi:MAG: glycosyltransferase family 4 protein [Myxococcota bacterium]|nr:glycosyltransferase family 4 protein [Myxococcota bacterium]